MNDIIKIGIEIPIANFNFTDSDVGMYNGTFRFTETGEDIDGLPSISGVLAEKWLSTISKTVDIRRTGNSSSYNGTSVTISNAFGLIPWLEEQGVSLSSQRINVIYEYDDGVSIKIGRLYSGIITHIDDDLDYIKIISESIDKHYKSPGSPHIHNSELYKPMFIGASNQDRTEYVDKTKGIFVDNGVNDILDENGFTIIWKVAESTSSSMIIKPLNRTMTLSDLNIYRDALEAISKNNNNGFLYADVIDGSGSGTKFVLGDIVRIISGGLEFSIGSVGSYTLNIYPDGILGELWEPYDTLEPLPVDDEDKPIVNFSILKIVEVDNFVQMDGFANTNNGYTGTSYLYDESINQYKESPLFGGGFYNRGDKMYQAKSTGDTSLDFGEFYDSNSSSNKQITTASSSDFEGLTIDDFPDDIKSFWIFDNDNRFGSGWYYEPLISGSPSTDNDPTSELPNMINKNVDDSYTAKFNYSAINNGGLDRVGWVTKIGMPQFTSKPSKLYFTADMIIKPLNNLINPNSDSIGVFVALYTNDYRGWKLIDYKWIDNKDTVSTEEPKEDDYFIKNCFPLNRGEFPVSTSAQERYLYTPANLEENRSLSPTITNRESFIFDLADYVLEEQTEFYMFSGARLIDNPAGLSMGSCEITVDEMSFSGEFDSDPEKTAFSYMGRAFNNFDRTVPNNNAGKFYEHILRLQDYTSQAIPRPNDGWGSAYAQLIPSEWDELIDSSNSYGGTSNVFLNTNVELEGQKLNYGEMNTETMKKELNRIMWGMGTIDNYGVEKVYPIIDAITNNDGTIITFFDLVDTKFSYKKRAASDIFTEGEFKYNFDSNTSLYNKKISITNVDADSYKSSYVQGVTNASEANRLWSMANKLYATYRIKNTFPKEIGETKLLKNEEDAINFIDSLYTWCGVDEDEGNFIVNDRYTMSFNIGLDFYIKNDLDHGSKILMDIPNLTPFSEYHSGIITSISINKSDKSTVKITCEMMGDITAGGDWLEIHESGSQTTDINETGSQEININERGL